MGAPLNNPLIRKLNPEELGLSSDDIAKVLLHFPLGIIAFDLETTGLSPLFDDIVEVAAIRLDASGAQLLHTLVNPERPIPKEVIAIHGIDDAMVMNAPKIGDVLPLFLELGKGASWMAHNARFDVGFILRACQKLKVKPTEEKVYCSCMLARKAFPKAPNHKLKTLTQYLTLTLENHHRASDDTLACLQIVAKGCVAHSRLVEQNAPSSAGPGMGPAKNRDLKYASFVYDLGEFKHMEEMEVDEKLRALTPLLTRGRPDIEILYKGGSKKNEYRPVQAIALLPMPNGNVLYGLCRLSNMHKSFSLKKIVDWRLINPNPMAKINSENSDDPLDGGEL